MELHIAPPDPDAVRRVVQTALAEDRARQDVTTRITVAPGQRGRGTFLAKQRGVVCGLDVVRETFAQMSADLALTAHAPDGAAIEAGDVVAEVAGPLAALLPGERVALNLLQRMSGTATMTRAFVERAAEGGSAEITDTRKTTPGLRELEPLRGPRRRGAQPPRHARRRHPDQGQPPRGGRAARPEPRATSSPRHAAPRRTRSASRSRSRTRRRRDSPSRPAWTRSCWTT